MADSYNARMDAINALVEDQQIEKQRRRERGSLSGWSEALTNTSNAAATPIKTASHIMSGSSPQQIGQQKNFVAPAMQRLDTMGAQDVLDKFRAADMRGRVLQEYEAAKQKKEHDDAKLAIERDRLKNAGRLNPTQQIALDSLRLRQDQFDYQKGREERAKEVEGFGQARSTETATKARAAIEAKKEFDRMVDGMIALRKKHGGGEILNRTDVGLGKQLSKDALLAYKNMAKLGVLSKSDEDIVNAIIPADPLAYAPDFSGRDPILSKLEAFRQRSDLSFKDKMTSYLKGGEEAAQNVSIYEPEYDPLNPEKPSGTAYADDKPADDYDNLSDEELQALLKAKGL